MKRVTTIISMLKKDLADDVRLKRPRAGLYIEFVNRSARTLRQDELHIRNFGHEDVDEMVVLLFDLSLTHYIDGYIPYDGADGKTMSYTIFFRECNGSWKNTNIDGEVVELMKSLLDSVPDKE